MDPAASTGRRRPGDVAKSSSVSLRKAPPPPPPPPPPQQQQQQQSEASTPARAPPPPPPLSAERSSLLADIQARRRRSSAARPPPPPVVAAATATAENASTTTTTDTKGVAPAATVTATATAAPDATSALPAAADSTTASLRRRLSKSEGEAKALQRRLTVSERLQESGRLKLEEELATAREERSLLQSQVDAMRNERTSLLERCAEVEQDLAVSRAEAKGAQKQLAAAREEASSARKELEELRASSASSAEASKEAAAAAPARTEEAIREIEAECNAKLRALDEELSAARRALASTEARSVAAEDTTEHLNQEVLRSRGESIIVANKLKDVMEALEGVKLELEDERDTVAGLTEERDALQAKLREAEENVANMKVFLEDGSNDDSEEESDGEDAGGGSSPAAAADRGATSPSRKRSVIEDFIRPVESSAGAKPAEAAAVKRPQEGVRRRSLLDGMVDASATIPEEEGEGQEEDSSSSADGDDGMEQEQEEERDHGSAASSPAAEISVLKAVIAQRDLDIERLESTIAALKPIQVEINALKNIIDRVGRPIEVDDEAPARGAEAAPRDDGAPPAVLNRPKVSPLLIRKLSASAALSSHSPASSPRLRRAAGSMYVPSRGAGGAGGAAPAPIQNSIQDIHRDEEIVFRSMLRTGWLMRAVDDEEAMASLVKRASVMHFEAGQRVIEKDFVGGGVLAVLHGKVVLRGADGEVAAVARQGDLLGESTIGLDDAAGTHSDEVQRQPFDIFAEEASSLFVLTVMDIESGLKRYPGVRASIMAAARAALAASEDGGEAGEALARYISRGSSRYIWSSNDQVGDATAASIEKIVGLQEGVLKLAGTRVEDFCSALSRWQRRCGELRVTTSEQLASFSKESEAWAQKIGALEEANEGLRTRVGALVDDLEAARASACVSETSQQRQRDTLAQTASELHDMKKRFSQVLTGRGLSMPLLNEAPADGGADGLEEDIAQATSGGGSSPSLSGLQNPDAGPGDEGAGSLPAAAAAHPRAEPAFTPAVVEVPASTISSQLSTLEKRCEALEARLFQQGQQQGQTPSAAVGAMSMPQQYTMPNNHVGGVSASAARGPTPRPLYLPSDHSVAKLLQLKELLQEVRGMSRSKATPPASGGAKDAAAFVAAGNNVSRPAAPASTSTDRPAARIGAASDADSVVRRDRLVDKLETIKLELNAFANGIEPTPPHQHKQPTPSMQ